MCHEGMCKLDKLFKPNVTNIFTNILGKMLFLNMSDASLVFFGKIHSNYFSLLLVPYHAAKSEKIFYIDPVV